MKSKKKRRERSWRCHHKPLRRIQNSCWKWLYPRYKHSTYSVTDEKGNGEAEVQMTKRLECLEGKQKCYRRCQECCNVVKYQFLLEDFNTLKEALSVPEKDKWRMAMEKKLKILTKNDSWTVVPRPYNQKIIRYRCQCSKRYSKNIQGKASSSSYTQGAVIDYKVTYTLVVKTKSI